MKRKSPAIPASAGYATTTAPATLKTALISAPAQPVTMATVVRASIHVRKTRISVRMGESAKLGTIIDSSANARVDSSVNVVNSIGHVMIIPVSMMEHVFRDYKAKSASVNEDLQVRFVNIKSFDLSSLSNEMIGVLGHYSAL